MKKPAPWFPAWFAVMSPALAILADDLTGAAEVAAMAARCGLRVAVLTADITPAGSPEVVVFDTDTRLDPAATAAQRVRAVARLDVVRHAPLVFKKTDSVLRGPVRAEVEALAGARKLTRVLLVPANPGLGRIVRNGRYFVHEQPVAETEFARDPHHPVVSSDVLAMLGAEGSLSASNRSLADELPASGLVIGSAATEGDLAAWAARVDRTVLPAGAAGFLRAILEAQGWKERPRSPAPARRGAVLIVSGTRKPALPPGEGGQVPLRCIPPDVPLVPLLHDHHEPATTRWHDHIEHELAGNGVAQLTAASLQVRDPDAASIIRRIVCAAVAALGERRAFTHLVVEGGATASAIVRALHWHELIVVHDWAQGVVTLRPARAPAIDLTIKPGSYAWPPALWKLWFSTKRQSSDGPTA